MADEPKIGAGSLGAAWRQGLAELRQIVSFGQDSIEQPTPYGMYGTPTPGEVASGKKPEVAEMNEEPKLTLAALRQQAEQQQETGGQEQAQQHEQGRGR